MSEFLSNNLDRRFGELMYQINPVGANLELPLTLIETCFHLPIKQLQLNKKRLGFLRATSELQGFTLTEWPEL